MAWTERQVVEATINMMKMGSATCTKDNETTLIPADELLEWYENKAAKLDDRMKREHAKREEQKAAGDELEKRVLELMTDCPMTCEEVTDMLGDEEITMGKVRYRLSALARKGLVAKTTINVVDDENKKKNVTAYALPMPSEF